MLACFIVATMAAKDEDYAPIDFNSYVSFPSGVYLVWSERHPHAHPPLRQAKFCPGGCNGPWLQEMWHLFEQLRLHFNLCYDSNTVHWLRGDGQVEHGLVIGPFYNQGREKGDRAMGYVKAMLDRDAKYRGDEFQVCALN